MNKLQYPGGSKYIDGTALGVDLGMTRAQPIFHSMTHLSTGNPTLEVPMEILDRINSTINRSTALELEDEIAIMTDLMTLSDNEIRNNRDFILWLS